MIETCIVLALNYSYGFGKETVSQMVFLMKLAGSHLFLVLLFLLADTKTSPDFCILSAPIFVLFG